MLNLQKPLQAVALAIAPMLAFTLTSDTASAQDAQQHRYFTTTWSFEDVDMGKLVSRLDWIGIEVPIEIAGQVTFNFSVSIPLDALRDAQAYRFNGVFRSNRLQLEQLLLADVHTDIRYANGVLTLSDLTTRWNDFGSLVGQAKMELVPRGNVSAALSARHLTIGPLHDLVLATSNSNTASLIRGTVDGTLSLNAPLNDFQDLTSWSLNADLLAKQLTYNETLPLTLDTGKVELRGGNLSAKDVRIGSPVDSNVRLAASVTAELRGDRPFEFTVRGNDVPVASLTKLTMLSNDSPIVGKVDLDVRGQGHLGGEGQTAAQWDLRGRLASPELSAFGLQLGLIEHQFTFDKQHLSLSRLSPSAGRSGDAVTANEDPVVIERFDASFEIEPQAVRLSQLDAAIFGGNIKGSAVLARGEAGRHQADLQWEQLEPRLDTGYFLPASARLSLRTSGDVKWSVAANVMEDPNAHQGTAQIAVDSIQLGDADIGEGKLGLQAAEGRLGLQGEGTLLGGTFKVETTMSLASLFTPRYLGANNQLPKIEGNVDLNQVDIALATHLLRPNDRRRFGGTFSANVELPQRAKLTISNANLDGKLLSQRIEADVELQGDQLQVNHVRGGYAGGRVEVVGRVNWRNQQGRLDVQLAAINASVGMKPISLTASQLADGSVSGHLVFDVSRDIKARGAIEVHDAEWYAVPTGAVHATVVGSAAKDFSRWTLQLDAIESTLNRGRISGNARLSSSTMRAAAFDLESSFQVKKLDFGQLLKDAGVGSSYARGNLSGQITLSGQGVRSAADLKGRFAAELDGTMARAVPGLVSAQAYLGAFSLVGARVDEGYISGSIAGGAARINEFWLFGESFRVLAEGRVQLPSGRMDVSAVVSTGNFDLEAAALATLVQRVSTTSAVPVAAIIQVNRLFSSRTLYFDLLGPLRDPRIRLKPLATLREGATNFLLRRAVSTVAGPALGGSIFQQDERP